MPSSLCIRRRSLRVETRKGAARNVNGPTHDAERYAPRRKKEKKKKKKETYITERIYDSATPLIGRLPRPFLLELNRQLISLLLPIYNTVYLLYIYVLLYALRLCIYIGNSNFDC